MQQGRQLTVVLGHTNHVHAFAVFDAGVGIGQYIQNTATGAHFVQIALELFQQRVIGRDRDHRHFAGHQRQRPMLEFARRIGLGVNVGDFLEFQSTFHRNRVVQTTPQEKSVFFFGKVFRPADELRLQRQHRLQGSGQMAHGFEVALFLGFRQSALGLGQCQC